MTCEGAIVHFADSAKTMITLRMKDLKMFGFETNFESMRPIPHHVETKTIILSSRPRPQKIGLETRLETYITATCDFVRKALFDLRQTYCRTTTVVRVKGAVEKLRNHWGCFDCYHWRCFDCYYKFYSNRNHFHLRMKNKTCSRARKSERLRKLIRVKHWRRMFSLNRFCFHSKKKKL